MEVANTIMSFLIEILDYVLPALNIPTEYMVWLDRAIYFFIGLLEDASFFIPIDVFVLCLTTMLIMDMFVFMFRLGVLIIGWVRG